jgi:molecular chaperone GrpE
VTDRDLPTGFDQEADETVGHPVVHDRRRVDPETGKLRPGSAASHRGAAGALPASDAAAAPGGNPLTAAQAEAAERLDDLKRLQAEYVNYRRRVERDRDAAREIAVASVLLELLPVLDDIGRAREHGDLNGGFRSVAEALEATVTKIGLERYGEPGDPFDPKVHEALMHEYSDQVEVPTCTQVLMPGYRFGSRILRAARVAVAEPTEELPVADDAYGAAVGETDED